jgi:ubiquitin-conjugating enzyme E2 Z
MFIPQSCAKRIVKDVKEILKNPLTEQGIYYQHDESNIMNGYAMILGPSDTPYENGFYLFQFTFPDNYPFSPPTLKYMTNDGITRFNPNLYKSGKVCLSILNTWMGEPWTSCQTISSILLTLCTLFNDNPIKNEPGFKEDHPDAKKYNQIITYKNFQVAICGMISQAYLPRDFYIFYPVMAELFKKYYDKNILRVKKLHEHTPNPFEVYTSAYDMRITIDYAKILAVFDSCNELLKM